MTLGHMRKLDVRSLDVSCWICPRTGGYRAPIDDRMTSPWVPSGCAWCQPLRHHRRRRPAELEGAAAAWDDDRGVMTNITRTKAGSHNVRTSHEIATNSEMLPPQRVPVVARIII